MTRKMGLCCCAPGPTCEDTNRPICYVDKDATGDADGTSWDDAYTSIQDAVDDCGSTHRIYIKGYGSGDKYVEDVDLDSKGACNLIGVETSGELWVEGEIAYGDYCCFYQVNVAASTYGFLACEHSTFVNCTGAGTGTGASHGNGFRDCHGCTFTECTGTGTGDGTGIGFLACYASTFTECTGTGTGASHGTGFLGCYDSTFTECTGTGTSTGAGNNNGNGFRGCYGSTFVNCTGTGTGTGALHGTGFRDCYASTFTECTGTGIGDVYGYGFYNCYGPTFTECTGTGTGTGNGNGFWGCGEVDDSTAINCTTHGFYGCTCTDCEAVDNGQCGYYDCALVSGNTASGNGGGCDPGEYCDGSTDPCGICGECP